MYSTSTYIIKDACWCLFVSTIHLGKHFTHSISWSIVNLDLTCFLIMYIIESLMSVWCFSLTSYLISFLRYPNNYIFIFKIHTFTGKCFSFNQIYFIFLEAWYGLNISFPISEMCLWIILYSTFQFPFLLLMVVECILTYLIVHYLLIIQQSYLINLSLLYMPTCLPLSTFDNLSETVYFIDKLYGDFIYFYFHFVGFSLLKIFT